MHGDDINVLRNMVGVLNSSLSSYYALMCMSSAGVEREQGLKKEKFSLPYVSGGIASHVKAIECKYADLEKLRLDESFDFVFDVKLENPNLMIEPLLMMPLMENAMKHCVNPDGKSFAHIFIEQKDDVLYFRAENSNFPRKSKSKSSGLGLATFQKRLELMYKDRT